MEVVHLLFRSMVALLLSVICTGGATAITIVAVVRGNAVNLPYAVAGSVVLVLLGGYIAMLASPYKPSIKVSSSFSGMSFAFARRDEVESTDNQLARRQSLITRMFAALALLCAGIVCIGGGIGITIVASLNKSELPNVYMAIMGGMLQCLFGGYLAMVSAGARPWIKASSGFEDGISLELTEK